MSQSEEPTKVDEPKNLVVWGMRGKPDTLTADGAENAADMLVEWLENTSQSVKDPRLTLRAVHIDEDHEDGDEEFGDSLFEIGVVTSEPLNEHALAELYAARDVQAILATMLEAKESEGDWVKSRNSFQPLGPVLMRTVDMLQKGEPLIDVIRMVATEHAA